MENPDEINNVFVKYIGDGPNVGDNHLFDKFGRCVISNKTKAEIMENTYNRDDFTYILSKIYSKNMIKYDKKSEIIVNELSNDFLDNHQLMIVKEELELLNKVIDKLPKNKDYHFIYNTLVILKNQGYVKEKDALLKEDLVDTILENPDSLFDDNVLKEEADKFKEKDEVIIDDDYNIDKVIGEKDLKSKKIIGSNKNLDKFNLNKLIIMLNSQIEANIEELANSLVSKDSEIKLIENNLSNLGEYIKLTKEFTDKNPEDLDKQNNFQYKKERIKSPKEY